MNRWRWLTSQRQHVIRILSLILVSWACCWAIVRYTTRHIIVSEMTQEIQSSIDHIVEVNRVGTPFAKAITGVPATGYYILLKQTPNGVEYVQGNRQLMSLNSLESDQELTKPIHHISQNGYTITAPLTVQGEWYRLTFFYPRDYYQIFRHEMRWILWGLGVLVPLLVIATYWTVFRFVAKPIENLNQALNGLPLSGEMLTSVSTLHQFPALTELTQTVLELEERLERRNRGLQKSQSQLKLLLNHLNLGVILINAQRRIEIVNPAAKNILGIDQDIIGSSYEEIVTSTSLLEMIDLVFARGEAISQEVTLYVPNQEEVDINIYPYRVTDKRQSGAVLVLLYNISEIRRLESIRTEFVANASHELRTPVTSIRGFAETLRDGALETPEVAGRFVDIIHQESKRLEHIINDILELSRIEKTNTPAITTKIDMYQVVGTVLTRLENKAKARGIELQVQIKRDVPLIIEGDPHRAEQILTNLVDNAINYSNDNSRVTVRLIGQQEGVLIRVVDEGIGIPLKDQERIFERFYRVDKGRSSQTGGTGLGLSIVRNLVNLFHGTISVESQLGKGTVFTVFLPYRHH